MDRAKIIVQANVPGVIEKLRSAGLPVQTKAEAVRVVDELLLNDPGALSEIISSVPVENDGLNASFNFTEKRSGPESQNRLLMQAGKRSGNWLNTVGDVLVSLLGGLTPEQAQMQAEIAAQAAQNAAENELTPIQKALPWLAAAGVGIMAIFLLRK